MAILFILISLSCVSGAENSTHLDDSASIQDYSPADFSKLADDINSSLPAKSIKLTSDYEFNPQNDGKYLKGIDISIDGMIIDGGGHTINANKQARIFNVKSNNLVLKNINFINAYSDSPGSCIYIANSNVSIINSTFKDSYSDKWGGAVSFRFGGIVINSSFENNEAGTGGALDFGDDAKVINSTFSNNFAKFQGGAISFYGNSVVENTVFRNNSGGDGACIYSDSLCSVYDSQFIRNYAIGYGGGIYFMAGGNVINSTFTQNTAKLDGGAINIRSQKLNVSGSEFNHNSANLGMSLFIKASTFLLENLTFNNENSSFDSEIYVDAGKPAVNNLTFNNVTRTPVPSSDIDSNNTTQPADNDKTTPTTVTKKKTTITAKSKTFKLKTKTKKYYITLKSGKTLLKNKKITLNIKGKTYAAKTNSKGKASIKIKLTKKGKFKGTITFKGDNTYKSSKKVIYIKIK